MISEVQRDVVEIQQILNTPKDNDKDQAVRGTCSLHITERTVTAT
jgi:hypothetical protein